MDLTKVFILMLLLTQTCNGSQNFNTNYCKKAIFNNKPVSIGHRIYIEADYKRNVTEHFNSERNKLNIPMNYLNWDIELDEVALNLLKRALVHNPCNSYIDPCLVRTPLRQDLLVYSDTAKNVSLNELKEMKVFDMYTKELLNKLANQLQNITSIGCGIWSLSKVCPNEHLPVYIGHLLCIFSGIKSTLLEEVNKNWSNLRGPCNPIVDFNYEYLKKTFDIDEFDLHIMYYLIAMTYSLTIMSIVFCTCLKSYHKKSLLSEIYGYAGY